MREEKLAEGYVKRIHVDQKRIRANLGRQRAEMEPPLTIQTSEGPLKAFVVEIEGPSRIEYSPLDPLSCGARVWIYTEAAVTIDPEGW